MARTPKVVEDRREQIIDAAMHVFAQKGFTKATNKDIAHEAGITPGLIYYYFESKDASGELRPIDTLLAVQVLIGSLIGFILRRQIIHDPIALAYSQEQIAHAVLDTVLNGLLPR